MTITGSMLIGGQAVTGAGGSLSAIDPNTGHSLEPIFGGATSTDLDRACALASDVFDEFRETAPSVRAALLDAIAERVEALGDTLVNRCVLETGLPRIRLEGERIRTLRQLRMFANVARDGIYVGARVDPAIPERQPPRVDIRMRNIPLGPVAVFGASNFPLAFSVAGGDTASALAAGAPVVAKAHPAHPGTSEMMGRAVNEAVTQLGLPAGVFSLIFDSGHDIGSHLVADPRIKAVAFTGSRRGGMALLGIAQSRPEPIPVYAEMSSVNPVILFPGALEERAEQIAAEFIESLTLGGGQLCTNAGLIIAIESPALERFLVASAQRLTPVPAATMLTANIHEAYEAGVDRVATHPAVTTLARGLRGHFNQGQAGLFSTTPADFLASEELQNEIFGAAALVVKCPDEATVFEVVTRLEGQLTATMQIGLADGDFAGRLLPLLERKAGRIIVNGFPTGVEVGHAMVHGGPFPSTSDSRWTSVGTLAIARFLRPISYQGVPDSLLPNALKDENAYKVPRMVDGRYAA